MGKSITEQGKLAAKFPTGRVEFIPLLGRQQNQGLGMVSDLPWSKELLIIKRRYFLQGMTKAAMQSGTFPGRKMDRGFCPETEQVFGQAQVLQSTEWRGDVHDIFLG